MYGIDLLRLPIHTSLISCRDFNEMNCRERALRRSPPGCFIPRRYKAKARLLPLHFSAAEIKGGFFSASAIKQGFIHLSLGCLSPSSAPFFPCCRFPGACKHKRRERRRWCRNKYLLPTQMAALEWGPRRGVSGNGAHDTLTRRAKRGREGGSQGRQQAWRFSFWLLARLMRMLLKAQRLKMGWHAGTKCIRGVFIFLLPAAAAQTLTVNIA